MWLITTTAAAIAVTVLWAFTSSKWRLGTLSLMLWGASVMILVDHVIGYNGGPFFEMRTDGLVPNAFLLGLLMLVPVFLIWGLIVLGGWKRGNPKTR